MHKRTGAIGFCAIGRSCITDTLKPACVGTADALKFFPQILHTTDDQFALKFDSYGINKELIGVTANFDTLRKDTIKMISDGLCKFSLSWLAITDIPTHSPGDGEAHPYEVRGIRRHSNYVRTEFQRTFCVMTDDLL